MNTAPSWAPDHRDLAAVARASAETKARGLTPCDVCGEPAAVLFGCHPQRFHSLRCAEHVVGLLEHFAIEAREYVTVAPLKPPTTVHTARGIQ